MALRGRGTSCDLLPDARAFGLLSGDLLTTSVQPQYGRPPDARLPAGVP